MYPNNNNSKKAVAVLRFFLGLICLAALMFHALPPAAASPNDGPIAYVRPNQVTGDEIHLIEPGGQNDRILWSSKTPPPTGIVDIQQLAWKPDASELAFTSSHEADCSLYKADIYTLQSDGQKYRRVSRPTACGNPDHLPTGTVVVTVENGIFDESGPFTIYFEGAPAPIDIALAPGESVELTFKNVADYGSRLQSAVAIFGDVRSYDPDTRVDVQPGATVVSGALVIGTGFEHYGFQWPTYRPDGSKIASMFNKDELFQVDANNRVPGLVGERLRILPTMSNDFLTWGPTPARANQYLYEGWNDSDTIFLGDANTGTSQLLITIDPLRIGKTLLGLTWLPDGSGFLYSVAEMVNYVDKADIFEYSFASGTSKRVTNVPGGFIRRMAISPDGKKIVYEYQQYGDWYQEYQEIDLWIMNRDGSEATLFVENGRTPAWSPAPLPEPVVYDHHIFLSLVRKP